MYSFVKNKIKSTKKTILLIVGFLVLFIFSYLNMSGKYWIGGDTIPNNSLFNFSLHNISFTSTQFGIPGPANGLSFVGFLPIGFVFYIISLVFHNFTDTVIFTLYIVCFLFAYYKMFQTMKISEKFSGLLAFICFINPYAWMLINRNVVFLLITIISIPLFAVSLKNVIERGGQSDWLKFLLVSVFFGSGSLVNPGYAIPALLFLFIYVVLFINNKNTIIRWVGVGIILLVSALPNILGQVNLLKNSDALQDDYWNNVILAQLPLEKQKTTNTFENVIRGLNSDTLGDYGRVSGVTYYPWWFTPYVKTAWSLVLFIPFFVSILLVGYVFFTEVGDKNKRIKILVLLSGLGLCIFFMKSSSGWGGETFARFMMEHGWFKMFRSPHAKFGFEFMLILTSITGICYSLITHQYVKKAVIVFLLIYITWGTYPLLKGVYIPQMQKTPAIPNAYFEVKEFLQTEKKKSNIDLGILLPPNSSTWDSNNWGYEGYHILHWLNTGVSFLNRNGLSFNKQNITSFNEWMKLTVNTESIGALKILKNQGYDVIVYDKTSDRTSRFGITETHDKNINWLNKQKQLKKVFESSDGLLIVYQFN